jgi:hypothetical protein
MRFRWITPLYGFDHCQPHIAVPEVAEAALLAMGAEMAGTDDLLAIYIPEGTDEVYQPGNMRGRIVCGGRLAAMRSRAGAADPFVPDTSVAGGCCPVPEQGVSAHRFWRIHAPLLERPISPGAPHCRSARLIRPADVSVTLGCLVRYCEPRIQVPLPGGMAGILVPDLPLHSR